MPVKTYLTYRNFPHFERVALNIVMLELPQRKPLPSGGLKMHNSKGASSSIESKTIQTIRIEQEQPNGHLG